MIKSMYTVRFSINNQTIMKGVFMATMPLRKYIHIIAFFLLPLSMMGEEDSFTEEAFRYTIIGEDRVEISSTENDSTFIQSQQDRILVIPHSVLHKGHSFIVVRISEKFKGHNHSRQCQIHWQTCFHLLREYRDDHCGL